ncbi:G5 domain-containing protein [Neobacillus sp. K501]
MHHSIKLFLVLILSSTFVFSFSQLGVKAVDLFGSKNSQFSSGTSIAAVNISGKSENEAYELLNTKISEWLKSTTITLQLAENTAQLDLSQLQFKLEETIKQAGNGQNQLIVTLDQKALEAALLSINPTMTIEDEVIQALVSEITTIASSLKTGEYILKLEDYLFATDSNEHVVLSEATIKLQSAPEDLQQAIYKISTIQIAANANFSVLDYLEKQGLKTISSSAKSIIASGIYQAILPTNFIIIEKNTSRELPVNIPLGYEANIDVDKNIDFVFNNPNGNNYTMNIVWEANSVKVTLTGNKLPNSYKIKADEIEYFSPKTIKQYSPLLKTGEKKVDQAGKKGVLIKVYREEYANNQLVRKELISEDFYPPQHKVEIHPLAEGTTTEQITVPNGTLVPSDPNTQIDPTSPSNPAQDTENANNGNQANQDESDLFGKPDETSK